MGRVVPEKAVPFAEKTKTIFSRGKILAASGKKCDNTNGNNTAGNCFGRYTQYLKAKNSNACSHLSNFNFRP